MVMAPPEMPSPSSLPIPPLTGMAAGCYEESKLSHILISTQERQLSTVARGASPCAAPAGFCPASPLIITT